jgi:hypothetical protein
MIGRMRHLVLVSVLASLAVGSCGVFGTRGLPIEFVNRTGKPIVLYELGRANPFRKELAPEERLRSSWVNSRLDDNAKDRVKFRVEATTESGDLVFCHDYTFNELTRAGWVVEIREQNDCRP